MTVERCKMTTMIVMMMAMGVMLAMVAIMLAMVVIMLAIVVIMLVVLIVAPSFVDSLFIIVLLNMSMYCMRDITTTAGSSRSQDCDSTGTGWHKADRDAHNHSSCISQLK